MYLDSGIIGTTNVLACRICKVRALALASALSSLGHQVSRPQPANNQDDYQRTEDLVAEANSCPEARQSLRVSMLQQQQARHQPGSLGFILDYPWLTSMGKLHSRRVSAPSSSRSPTLWGSSWSRAAILLAASSTLPCLAAHSPTRTCMPLRVLSYHRACVGLVPVRFGFLVLCAVVRLSCWLGGLM